MANCTVTPLMSKAHYMQNILPYCTPGKVV